MSNEFLTEYRGNLFVPLITRQTIDVETIQRFFSKTNLTWTKERTFTTDVGVNPIYRACQSAISLGKYEIAINLMQNRITSWCEVLAKAFNKNFEGKEYTSHLIEILKQENKIPAEEANRILVILMALDGLEIEVREYGMKMNYEDLEYLIEFEEIMERVMKGMKVNIDTSLLHFTTTDFATIYPEVMTIGLLRLRQPVGICDSISFSHKWDNMTIEEITIVS